MSDDSIIEVIVPDEHGDEVRLRGPISELRKAYPGDDFDELLMGLGDASGEYRYVGPGNGDYQKVK